MFCELLVFLVPSNSDDIRVDQFITTHTQHNVLTMPHTQCPVCLIWITLNQIVRLSHNICLSWTTFSSFNCYIAIRLTSGSQQVRSPCILPVWCLFKQLKSAISIIDKSCLQFTHFYPLWWHWLLQLGLHFVPAHKERRKSCHQHCPPVSNIT